MINSYLQGWSLCILQREESYKFSCVIYLVSYIWQCSWDHTQLCSAIIPGRTLGPICSAGCWTLVGGMQGKHLTNCPIKCAWKPNLGTDNQCSVPGTICSLKHWPLKHYILGPLHWTLQAWLVNYRQHPRASWTSLGQLPPSWKEILICTFQSLQILANSF